MDFNTSKTVRRKSLFQSALILIEARIRIAQSRDRIRKSHVAIARGQSPYAEFVRKAELN